MADMRPLFDCESKLARATDQQIAHARAREIAGSRSEMVPDGDDRCRGFVSLGQRGNAPPVIDLRMPFQQLAFFFFDGERFWLCPGLLDETAVALPST